MPRLKNVDVGRPRKSFLSKRSSDRSLFRYQFRTTLEPAIDQLERVYCTCLGDLELLHGIDEVSGDGIEVGLVHALAPGAVVGLGHVASGVPDGGIAKSHADKRGEVAPLRSHVHAGEEGREGGVGGDTVVEAVNDEGDACGGLRRGWEWEREW